MKPAFMSPGMRLLLVSPVADSFLTGSRWTPVARETNRTAISRVRSSNTHHYSLECSIIPMNWSGAGVEGFSSCLGATPGGMAADAVARGACGSAIPGVIMLEHGVTAAPEKYLPGSIPPHADPPCGCGIAAGLSHARFEPKTSLDSHFAHSVLYFEDMPDGPGKCIVCEA